MRTLSILWLGVLLTVAALGSAAAAPTLRQGVAAMARQDYAAAVAILSPLAQNGDPAAQAADQGHSGAQYELGLLYDKGQGLPVNVIQAEKWLILATAAAPKAAADDRTRMRDAVRTKMTLGELAQARTEALAWQPRPEGR